jgi:hypothetical protein
MGGGFRWGKRKVVILSLFGNGYITEITIKIIYTLFLLLLLLALQFCMSYGLLNNSLPGFSIHSHLTPIPNHLSQMLSHTRHSHPLFYMPHILLYYLVLHEMHCCHLPVWKVAKKIHECLRFTLAKHVSNKRRII